MLLGVLFMILLGVLLLFIEEEDGERGFIRLRVFFGGVSSRFGAKETRLMEREEACWYSISTLVCCRFPLYIFC